MDSEQRSAQQNNHMWGGRRVAEIIEGDKPLDRDKKRNWPRGSRPLFPTNEYRALPKGQQWYFEER
jgi:hypothetical protein